MKDPMVIARLVKGLDEETVEREVFALIKQDKQWLNDIVKQYVEFFIPDVVAIKQLVNEYNNPVEMELEEDK